MPIRKKIRVIIDTNLFVSFLIGKRLQNLRRHLVDSDVILLFSEQNILELKYVTTRAKFQKYFSPDDVNDLLDFITIIGQVYPIKDIPKVCRDPKDDFLLGLALTGNADFLVTGDHDLLEIQQFEATKIITIQEFEEIIGS